MVAGIGTGRALPACSDGGKPQARELRAEPEGRTAQRWWRVAAGLADRVYMWRRRCSLLLHHANAYVAETIASESGQLPMQSPEELTSPSPRAIDTVADDSRELPCGAREEPSTDTAAGDLRQLPCQARKELAE